MEVDDVMLILFIHQRRGNHKIGSRFIVGDRDIVNLGDSKKRLDIRIVRLGGQGIGEEDDKINLSLDDFCTDLLVAAQRTAVIALDRKPGICFLRISLFASHQSMSSRFLLSCAMSAIFFCFRIVIVKKSIESSSFAMIFA